MLGVRAFEYIENLNCSMIILGTSTRYQGRGFRYLSRRMWKVTVENEATIDS